MNICFLLRYWEGFLVLSCSVSKELAVITLTAWVAWHGDSADVEITNHISLVTGWVDPLVNGLLSSSVSSVVVHSYILSRSHLSEGERVDSLLEAIVTKTTWASHWVRMLLAKIVHWLVPSESTKSSLSAIVVCELVSKLTLRDTLLNLNDLLITVMMVMVARGVSSARY